MTVINSVIKGKQPVIDTLSVTPSTSAQQITAPDGTDGYSPVNVSAVTAAIDNNITAGNIKSGVSILGVSGSVTELNGTTTTINPSTSEQTVSPTSPSNGFTSVTVPAVTSSIDANIVAGNIKKDVTILGVTGSFEGGTIPTGTLNIPANNTYDVTNYAYAVVNVPTTAPDYYINLMDDGNGTLIKASPVPTISTGSSVTSLGTRCLYYEYYNISFPANTDIDLSGITSLDTYALAYSFQYATGLRNVNLGNLQTIASNSLNYAFGNSSIVSLDLHSLNITDTSTQSISNLCRNCTSLTTVDLSSMTTFSGSYAFYGCTNLQTVTLPNNTNVFNGGSAFYNSGITTINGKITSGSGSMNYMFQGCTNLTTVDFLKLSRFDGSQNANCTFRSMFQGCTGITSVDLSSLTYLSPGNINYFAANMFDGCTSLETVDLSNLTTISFGNSTTQPLNYIFANCTSLRSINLDKLANVYGKVQYIFQNCTSLTNISLPVLTSFSDAVGNMFNGSGLVSFSAPLLQGGNGDYAYIFYNCPNLTTVDIRSLRQNGNSSFLQRGFDGCTSLKEMKFQSFLGAPNYAMAYTFNNCTSLETVWFYMLDPNVLSQWAGERFSYMLSGCTNVTVHFPIRIRSYMESVAWPSVQSGFDGTNTTILYDLVTSAVGADSNTYTRQEKDSTSTATAWVLNNTLYYTSGNIEPQVGDTIYSDSACTTAVTTISTIS